MFLIAVFLLTGFTGLYLLASIAVIYHLNHYILATQKSPKAIIRIFALLSIVLWSGAFIALFNIPR